MKNKLILSLVSACLGITNVLASSNSPATLSLNQIQIVPNESAADQFSIMANFTNHGSTISTWQLGFYMPRTFASLSQAQVNQDLDMQMCEQAGRCVNLRYVKANAITAPDLSQGYFTVLEPLTPFSLAKNGRYMLRLLNNNQGLPLNVSAWPQSWFLITEDYAQDQIPDIYTISSELTQYTLVGYEQDAAEVKIHNQIISNWQNSQPLESSVTSLIVPTPVQQVLLANNDFTWPSQLTIHNQLNANNSVVNLWAKIIGEDLHLKTVVKVDNDSSANDGIIVSAISDPRIIHNSPEGYRLSITSSSINIEAMTDAGVYYALQSLRQLWFANKGLIMPGMIITDFPRFKYRGILLDVTRHYFTPEQIKNLLDIMAAQKLNTLHLHLSDDEALRVMSAPGEPYALAAVRGLGQLLGPSGLVQNNLDTSNHSQINYPYATTSYAGSYSVLELKDIIAYANLRQITILPEIDAPSHVRALIKARPDLFSDPNDNSQYISHEGYTDNVLPVCTYATGLTVGPQFTTAINNLIESVTQIFNQQSTIYAVNNEISIGGDQVSNWVWGNDSSCRDDWQGLSANDKEHLFWQKLAQNESALVFSGRQWLVQNADGSLAFKRIDPSQIGHIWVAQTSLSGVDSAVTLANADYPTVVTFADKADFNVAYTSSIYEPGETLAGAASHDTYAALAMAKLATLSQGSSHNPANIIGMEGALWSQNLASMDHLMYMALPKMTGIAEGAWSSLDITVQASSLNWQSLAERLGCGKQGFLAYLNQLYAVNYRGYPHGITLEVPPSVCLVDNESNKGL